MIKFFILQFTILSDSLLAKNFTRFFNLDSYQIITNLLQNFNT
jgi:hypothetical protein